MIFNDKTKDEWWILEREPVVSEFRNQLVGTSETKPENLDNDLYVCYFGKRLPIHPKLTDDGIVEATAKDLVEKQIYSLSDGEFIDGEHVKTKWDYTVPDKLIKPEFNYETLAWEETATSEELEEHAWNKEVGFYNTELEFASKAHAELACEIITPEMFEDVKLYMKAIDPYATKSKRMKKVGRPSIFDRYK